MSGSANRVMETPQHHISDEWLLDYASGSLDEAASLFVASHLTYCPECRARAQELEAFGGEIFDRIDPAPLSASAMDAMMARLDVANDADLAGDTMVDTAIRPKVKGDVLPAPLRSYLGCDLDQVVWQKRGGGVSVAEIEGYFEQGQQVYLLKVDAGRAVPQHTHEGNEMVMVLAGSYQDESGTFAKGDVEVADSAVDHQPIAGSTEDCVCLVVTDAPLRFTGSAGWLLNMFVKM